MSSPRGTFLQVQRMLLGWVDASVDLAMNLDGLRATRARVTTKEKKEAGQEAYAATSSAWGACGAG